MRRSRKLGKLAQCVFKDLIVVPIPCVSSTTATTTKQRDGAKYFVSFSERGGIFSSRFQ